MLNVQQLLRLSICFCVKFMYEQSVYDPSGSFEFQPVLFTVNAYTFASCAVLIRDFFDDFCCSSCPIFEGKCL